MQNKIIKLVPEGEQGRKRKLVAIAFVTLAIAGWITTGYLVRTFYVFRCLDTFNNQTIGGVGMTKASCDDLVQNDFAEAELSRERLQASLNQ